MPTEHVTDRPPIDVRQNRRYSDFTLPSLRERKQQAAATVSVVIPALNEESTVGHVVDVLRRTLIDEAALVDELVVVDADSADRTAERARAAGARVVRQSQVLADLEPASGKGEALWKGLAATSGDLVVFIDADIYDIGPRFVVGLLGPLLTDDTVLFTKATYDRPLRRTDGSHDSGGGRVTELLARPLIGAFWPELSWLAQPLSGEYAGRRDVLESVPFVCGYGVELALLVDVAAKYGVDAIVQVDIGKRTHNHQPLDALGRMSAEILRTALERLQQHDRLILTDEPNAHLLQPVRDTAGVLAMQQHAVNHTERPPLAKRRQNR